METKVMRNAKEIDGATAINIAGTKATIEVATGSELDGLLYYNWTRDGRPRLGFHDKTSQRFKIEKTGDNTYELEGLLEIRS